MGARIRRQNRCPEGTRASRNRQRRSANTAVDTRDFSQINDYYCRRNRLTSAGTAKNPIHRITAKRRSVVAKLLPARRVTSDLKSFNEKCLRWCFLLADSMGCGLALGLGKLGVGLGVAASCALT
jgi:hypothetical protein